MKKMFKSIFFKGNSNNYLNVVFFDKMIDQFHQIEKKEREIVYVCVSD